MTQPQAVAPRTFLEMLEEGRKTLLCAGIEEAGEECDRVAMKVLGCERFELRKRIREQTTEKTEKCFSSILEKRKQRIPLAYLLKEAHFGNETLLVDERCLVPRPETEILVEKLSGVLRSENKRTFSFLDIGTGSGAIAVALLRFFDRARGTLLDLSPGALAVAGENLKRYGLEGRAQVVQGDLFQPFCQGELWDVIVSNPPYLAAADWENIQEELKLEPREALDGGEDGLDYYRRIIARAWEHLLEGGRLAFEVGWGQAGVVSKWLQDAGYVNILVFEDYQGIQRVIIAQKVF